MKYSLQFGGIVLTSQYHISIMTSLGFFIFWIIKLHMVIIVFQHIFNIPSISLIMWAENLNTTHSPYNERQKFG